MQGSRQRTAQSPRVQHMIRSHVRRYGRHDGQMVVIEMRGFVGEAQAVAGVASRHVSPLCLPPLCSVRAAQTPLKAALSGLEQSRVPSLEGREVKGEEEQEHARCWSP